MNKGDTALDYHTRCFAQLRLTVQTADAFFPTFQYCVAKRHTTAKMQGECRGLGLIGPLGSRPLDLFLCAKVLSLFEEFGGYQTLQSSALKRSGEISFKLSSVPAGFLACLSRLLCRPFLRLHQLSLLPLRILQ